MRKREVSAVRSMVWLLRADRSNDRRRKAPVIFNDQRQFTSFSTWLMQQLTWLIAATTHGLLQVAASTAASTFLMQQLLLPPATWRSSFADIG